MIGVVFLANFAGAADRTFVSQPKRAHLLSKNRIASGAGETRMPVEVLQQKQNEAGALAVWITEADRLQPIQAVGGWLR
ncbi:hypothetical protein BH20VER3_BH20VER3_21800 [soil metagenome]